MASLNLEYLFLKIYDFFFSAEKSVPGIDLSGIKAVIGFLMTIVSIIFIAIIIYSFVRLKEIREKKKKDFKEKIRSFSGDKKEEEDRRWQMVLDFITSDSPSDWKIAVLEADKILDDLTKDLGLIGDNLGDRLKNAPAGQFNTIQSAWDAHKVRNKIAHDGPGEDITYQEAKRAIEDYEKVFNEFKYI